MTKRPPRPPRPPRLLRRLRRFLPTRLSLLVIPLLLLLTLSLLTSPPHPPPPHPLSLTLPPTLHPLPSTLPTFIHLATSYIIRASYLGHHGPASFLYRPTLHPPTNSLSDTPDYNTLRHAGALYSLAQVCPPPYPPATPAKFHPCHHVPPVLRRGAQWLLNHTVREVPAHPGLYGVWTHPEWTKRGVAEEGETPEMKLGALGLGLVALVAAEEVERGTTSRAVLDGLGGCMTRLMRRRDGGFWSYFKDGRVDEEREMRYYPGEAALGLIRLGEFTGVEDWIAAAAKGLAVMGRTWGGDKCDHWGMIAVAELRRVGWKGVEWEGILQWARKVVAVCDGLNRERLDSGGVRGAGYATGLEAVVAMAPLLVDEGKEDMAAEMLCVVGRMLVKMAQVQWRVGEGGREMLEGAMPGAAVAIQKADGLFVERREGFQIDSTQHSLSAAVGFVKAVAKLSAPLECSGLDEV